MTGQERDGLLLAARLLERGLPVDGPVSAEERNAGHVSIALALAERLSRVIEAQPERAEEIVASLRAAAHETTAV